MDPDPTDLKTAQLLSDEENNDKEELFKLKRQDIFHVLDRVIFCFVFRDGFLIIM